MGSLFAGIGGFDLGFERAGFKTSWQVEIDPYCQKVLAKNFPEAERFGDIRECGSHNLKSVDVICGGFPCQDISVAGKRAGIGGERSGLWAEMYRIFCELRPSYCVIENVAALVGLGLERVLCDLAAGGFDAEWDIVSAADAGAPHLRRRIWIVAYPQRERLPSEWDMGTAWASGADTTCTPSQEPSHVADSYFAGLEGWDGEELRQRPRERITGPSSACAVADAPRLQQGRQEQWPQRERTGVCGESIIDSYPDIFQAIRSAISRRECDSWEPEPNVGRVAHGVPKRVDRLRGLGNAVIPQIPEMIARRIKQALESNQ